MPATQLDVLNAVQTLTYRGERTTAADVALEPGIAKADATSQLMAACRADLLTAQRPPSRPPDHFVLTPNGERVLADALQQLPAGCGHRAHEGSR